MGPSAITFLLSSLGYAFLLCPSVYWLDSGELAAASFELGIVHAPGHPLAALIGKLFCFLPIGDIALRVGLGQLFCGAGAAAVVTWIGVRIARRFIDEPRAALLGIAAGLLYATSYAAAFQAIRPEVYALSALLTLGALALCLRYAEAEEPRLLGLAGLLFGLGLANHHYLVLLGAVPPAIALLWRRAPGLPRGLALGALGTAVGLLPYLYLPLRAAHDPLVDWGHESTWSRFFWTVSAQSFQKAAGVRGGQDLPSLLGALLEQLTPLGALLGLGGLYLCLRRHPRLGLALLLALLGPIGARLLVSFDAGNPDAYGYLSTGIAALALCMVPLLAAVLSAAPVRWRSPLSVLLVLLSLGRGALAAPSLSLARFDEVTRVFSPLLEKMPADAVVVSSYFQTGFSLAYLRVVEGVRPDLSYVHRHALSHPGERDALLRRDPSLAGLLGDEDLVIGAALALPRPLVLEYDLDIPAPLVARAGVIPLGVVGDGIELQTRRFAAWQSYLRLHQLCRVGAPPAQIAQGVASLRRRAGLAQGGASAAIDPLLANCPQLRGR